MKWEKFTIETTTEAEDLVSNMLMELGIEGIEIEDNIPLSKEDTMAMFVDILPELPPDEGKAKVNFYLEPEEEHEELIRQIKEGLEELRAFVEVGAGTITESETEDKDWMNNWKQYFKPFTVDDILIKPTWEEIPEADADKLLIQIDPGTAFGTGMHETTQLCIRQLKKYITPETRLLDVGTGSGILSIVGLKLGAKSALGTDLDPNAISAARENMESNDISPEDFKVMIGNIIDDEEMQKEIGFGCYDIVVANILADIIIPLQAMIAGQIKPGGLFISSGIIDMKEQAVLEAIGKNPELEVVEITRQGEWVSITAKKIGA
ncbi:MAG: 50S ribosomal protein L11 methyltransferase [Lachnospiraceae bacterium]|nr:50S ribosomal protein L11 methyltransferase [Lachnospiraceae bacterium]